MVEWVPDNSPSLPEVDGHTWMRPAPDACPNCVCCAERLCAKGFEHAFGCSALCASDDYETVKGCPCSSEDKEGSAAYRAALARARRRATHLPLDPQAERLLRHIADGTPPVGVHAEYIRILTAFRYVLVAEDGTRTLTAAGRAYVNERGGDLGRSG